MLIVLLKKKQTDYATEISGIKNDYVTTTELTSRLNDLKNTHSDEINKVNDKAKKMVQIFWAMSQD